MKICMIGCGDFARHFHGPAQQRYAAQHPDVELAACCDVDEPRAREYRRLFGFARHETDARAMLAATRPDAVVLAVPPDHTCRAARMVLAQGFPLLIEKPPAMNPAELLDLVATANQSGARTQVAFNRRFMPVLQRAREILDDAFPPNAVARIACVMTRFDRWDRDFSTTAIHAIDTALFLARSPFRTAEIRYQPQWREDREATNVIAELECISGTGVQLTILPVAGRNADTVAIHAPGQTLTIDVPVYGPDRGGGRLEHWRANELVASFVANGGDLVERMGVSAETAAFLDAVRSGAEFAPRLEDCHPQVALMEAIRLRRTGPIDITTR